MTAEQNPMTPPSTATASIHAVLAAVTQRIAERSQTLRADYEASMVAQAARSKGIARRAGQGCANLAHAYAAAPVSDKIMLLAERAPNIGVVTAYNDMLSAHQPFQHFPDIIKAAARSQGATAQVAGGVPAMCDGVTQGEAGMELSLFSRDTIAMAAGIALSHNVFDAALYLGVCDKIVPGLFMGACAFGYLPSVFVPAGPMASGLANDAKAKIRQQYAQGLVGREELLKAESAAYHSAGTCTFYGTANSNQMLMEIMGLHLPGSSFVNPYTALRYALTEEATRVSLSAPRLYEIVTAKTVVNGIVGLLATGGSTNHTLHIIAMARAAGLLVNWDDFAELSAVVPLISRVYPNGSADVNHFHAAGGMPYLIRELLSVGLLHEDVQTVLGAGLAQYAKEPWLDNGVLSWRAAPMTSADEAVLRPAHHPFSPDGGLRLVQGNLGRAVVKVSAVKPEHRIVRAPAVVVNSQQALQARFKAGELERDFIAVVRYQGPRANGMPELHKLTPPLAVLQDKGFKVALVTDGRMSGASGKVPAAIHLSDEALAGGMIAKVEEGDMISLNCETGELVLEVAAEVLAQRVATPPTDELAANQYGTGRELFALMRRNVSGAESGACSLYGTAH